MPQQLMRSRRRGSSGWCWPIHLLRTIDGRPHRRHRRLRCHRPRHHPRHRGAASTASAARSASRMSSQECAAMARRTKRPKNIDPSDSWVNPMQLAYAAVMRRKIPLFTCRQIGVGVLAGFVCVMHLICAGSISRAPTRRDRPRQERVEEQKQRVRVARIQLHPLLSRQPSDPSPHAAAHSSLAAAARAPIA